jgi:hypothetical protein
MRDASTTTSGCRLIYTRMEHDEPAKKTAGSDIELAARPLS